MKAFGYRWNNDDLSLVCAVDMDEAIAQLEELGDIDQDQVVELEQPPVIHLHNAVRVGEGTDGEEDSVFELGCFGTEFEDELDHAALIGDALIEDEDEEDYGYENPEGEDEIVPVLEGLPDPGDQQ